MKILLSLVGAGPGDPELITLKAIKTLSRADVILYDALVNPVLLDYARPDAVKEFAGKRFGCHSLSQAEINQRIIEFAFSHGRETPVAIIQNGTTSSEKMVTGKVKDIIHRAAYAGLTNPAVIIVGNTINQYLLFSKTANSKNPATGPHPFSKRQ